MIPSPLKNSDQPADFRRIFPHMQMPRRNATASKGVANEPVAAMMNRQRAESVGIQDLAGGADLLR